jgi:hypothetical protein
MDEDKPRANGKNERTPRMSQEKPEQQRKENARGQGPKIIVLVLVGDKRIFF